MPAPKGNRNAVGNKGGKGGPAKYKPEYARIAKEMYHLGATDYEVAAAFGVSNTTIKMWLVKHVEFALSCRPSSEHCTDRVEKSLFHKATGYTFESEKVFQHQGEIVRAKTVEHVPPDTNAAQFWLKNRRKDEWQDTSRSEHTGKDGGPIETKEVTDIEAARRVAYMFGVAMARQKDAVPEA